MATTETDRVTFRISEKHREQLDDLIGEEGPYFNQSTAIRAAIDRLHHQEVEIDGER